ncbi:succinate dehydrogenase [Aspergillus sp. HF37]|nr:succinate dehydrogenase [Aspergillus sp. HF37]
MASIVRQSPLLRQSCLSAPRSAFAGKNAAGVSQVVAFHASAKKQILPPPPQTIPGTVNDPAYIPKPHPSEGSYHWTFERIIAAGLVPLTIAPFAAGSLNPAMDATLCALLVVHSHVGFQYAYFPSTNSLGRRLTIDRSSVIDYFPEQRVAKTRKLLNWLLRGFTLTTAVGLYEFETNDVGVTEAIKRIWKA